MADRTQENSLLTTASFLIKDILKNINEEPDKEVHRVISKRVLSVGALSLWSWDVPSSQQVDVFANLEAL